MGYRAFLRENRSLLALGFLLCFFSSFGQTFFLGVFGGVLREEFELSNAAFGSLYSFATLTSGTALLFLGPGVDRHDLRRYAVVVCCGMVAACVGLSLARHVAVLFVALVALRLFGQGLMSHVSITTMARYFGDHQRAKAISLASIGFAVGEAIWPRSAIALLGHGVGRQQLWLGLAALAGAVLVPLVLTLLRDHGARHAAFVRDLARETADESPVGERPDAGNAVPAHRHQWTREAVLRDPRFWMLVPAALATPMIVTGLFFHQVRVAELRGWSMALYGSCFIGYAAAQFVTSLACGPLTDRLGARRVFPWILVPMCAGLLVLLSAEGPVTCACYLATFGVTAGASATVGGTLWAEAYAVLHAGAIRALTATLMVFSTATTPGLLGYALDASASVADLAAGCLVFCVFATALASVAAGRAGERAAPRTAPETP